MSLGAPARRKNRRRVSTLDPQVYAADRIGFLRGLRAIHRAAELGCDTSGSYLIVEYGKVVGIGGCVAAASQEATPPRQGWFVVRPGGGGHRGPSGR